MDMTITFTIATVNTLTTRLRWACDRGQRWLIGCVCAILMLSDQLSVYTITERILAWRLRLPPAMA